MQHPKNTSTHSKGTKNVRGMVLYLFMIAANSPAGVVVAVVVLMVCPLVSVNSLVPAGLTLLL